MADTSTFEQRFFRAVDNSDSYGCWPWMLKRDKNGYGRLRLGNRFVRSNRASWIIHNGDIPAGMQILHQCDNPACCNPAHLFLGTAHDNMIDKTRKGRNNVPSGDRHYRRTSPERGTRGHGLRPRKLTREDAAAIRTMYAKGETQRSIAERFGVTQATISEVVRYRTWAA